MRELASLLVLGLMLIALISLVRADNAGRWRDRLVAYSLRFPQPGSTDCVPVIDSHPVVDLRVGGACCWA